jgi:hypothetical protein
MELLSAKQQIAKLDEAWELISQANQILSGPGIVRLNTMNTITIHELTPTQLKTFGQRLSMD